MSIRILEINVQNLGPIQKLSLEFGRFNLIYGRNERGKTFLVEFLIRSLFRNPRSWQTLRAISAPGIVRVAGLDIKVVNFSPSSTTKIEDYWQQDFPGLPPDFCKLLVVKGAEVELAGVEGGVDKNVLKRYLSNQGLLDALDNKISKSIQEARLENQAITAPMRGEIKERERLQKQLQKIDELFAQIDKGYSGAKRVTLAEEKDRLKEKLSQFEKARRHRAYRLSQEISQLESQKRQIDENKVKQLRDDIQHYRSNAEAINRKEATQQEAERNSRHYLWLKNAREVYQNQLAQIGKRPSPVFLILSLLSLISCGAFIYLKMPIAAAIALAGVLLLGFLYFRLLSAYARRSLSNAELEKLAQEFTSRFEIELTGLPQLEELLPEMEQDFNKSQILKEQLQEEVQAQKSLEVQITTQISDFSRGRQFISKNWTEIVHQLESELSRLDAQIQDRRFQLAALDVDEADHESEPSSIEYSKREHERIANRLGQVEEQLGKETQKLAILKQAICNFTDDQIGIPWEQLIQNLREKHQEMLVEYQQVTAKILGQMAVHAAVQELRRDEDSKISEGLKSSEVVKPLEKLTQRYNALRMDGERLIVADPFQEFRLSDLSTGAQQQVLLALRIGFSVKILQRNSLFLILDDAFQYSDWQRREWLMNMMVGLAKHDWQILYFTMDDHIKRLFDERGKEFGDEYKSYEIAN